MKNLKLLSMFSFNLCPIGNTVRNKTTTCLLAFLFLIPSFSYGETIAEALNARIRQAKQLIFPNGCGCAGQATLEVELVTEPLTNPAGIYIGVGIKGVIRWPDGTRTGTTYFPTTVKYVYFSEVKNAKRNWNIPESLNCSIGSVIDFGTKNVSEQIPIDGTNFYLNYSTANNPELRKNRTNYIDKSYLNQVNEPFTKIKMAIAESNLPEQQTQVLAITNNLSELTWD
ncbi:MAG: hypothetical protein ABL930_12020, partial [Pseudobdellovibrio sp.]